MKQHWRDASHSNTQRSLMNFEKAVSDDPVFPADELSGNRIYRPDMGDPNYMERTMKGAAAVFFAAISIIIFSKQTAIQFTTFEVLLSLIVLFFLILTVFTLYFRRSMLNVSRLTEVTGLAAQGKLDDAAKLADDICKKVQSVPATHCYALYERASVATRQGDYALARNICGAIVRSGVLAKPDNPLHIYWGLSIGLLAANSAALGRIQEAETWQTYARQFVEQNWRGALMGTDLMIGIRTGRSEIVVADTERDWLFAEAVLGAKGLRTIRLLCAFGLSQINADGSKTEAIDRWLASLHPHARGDFDHLAKHWPELQNFIAEKNL
jgi:hypothetical protein